MSLITRVVALAQAIGADIKALRAGKLSLDGGLAMTGHFNEAPPVTLASAATVAIGAAAANTIKITGTTTITAFDSVPEGVKRTTLFSTALTLTHNATSLQLMASVSFATAAGDVAEWESLGGGNWKMIDYVRNTGYPLSIPGSVYTKSNVVGPLGLAGGVPTGAIVESGTNANGTYVRYADGTQECWFFVSLAYNGSPPLPQTIYSWTFPAAFAGFAASYLPNIVVQVGVAYPQGSNNLDVQRLTAYASSGAVAQVEAAWTPAQFCYVTLKATGRWY
ncbi:hypothetical protein ABQX22_18180 [Xanthomonas sp. WHRI 1810A]|uniref:hypothetical protein n=1 Tax=Xanthomonas sp. WHRI 1810A TaxID=3161565 RepID=UPI0032E855F4